MSVTTAIVQDFNARFSREVDADPKLSGLGMAYEDLGPKGMDAIMLGLSRKIRTTVEDAHKVISEWERRDKTCCYQGTAANLLKLTDTYVMAVSYKHEDMSKWYRKGENLTAKMSDSDQEELTKAITGYSKFPGCEYVVLWCDQVISTRLQNAENSLGWYNAGLLPYMSIRVLQLSSHISDEVLESRVWLRAERSLGRLGRGIVGSRDAALGLMGDFGQSKSIMDLVESLAGMILSGYWPEDLGYWANDYEQMKKWAVTVLCDRNGLVDPPLFDDIRKPENGEILASMYKFCLVPRGLEEEEKPLHTADCQFFLKATAWNLSVRDVWDLDRKTVSHYMGHLGPLSKFSWWTEDSGKTIFGYLYRHHRATAVIAVKDRLGYTLHRHDVPPEFYSHAEQVAGENTMGVLREAAQKCGVDVNLDNKWSLLYSSNNDFDEDPTYKADPVVRNAMGTVGIGNEIVAAVYQGLTMKLYLSAVRKWGQDRSAQQVAEHFLQLRDQWNSHIQETYGNWISVRDTTNGPNWLEGYTDKTVSFGFYDFLTRSLILGDNSLSDASVVLPTKWEFVKEVRRVASSVSRDIQILASDLYGDVTEENCDKKVKVREVAIFMVKAGFTTGMDEYRLGSFLGRVAEFRGYWRTKIFSNGGKLQVIFFRLDEDVRILQRVTDLPEFHAAGLVRPEDAEAVHNISVPVGDDPEQYNMYMYWKSMESNTTKTELQNVFRNSVYALEDGQRVLLVDMSIIGEDAKQERSANDAHKSKAEAKDAEDQLRMQLGKMLKARLEQGTVSKSTLTLLGQLKNVAEANKSKGLREGSAQSPERVSILKAQLEYNKGGGVLSKLGCEDEGGELKQTGVEFSAQVLNRELQAMSMSPCMTH